MNDTEADDIAVQRLRDADLNLAAARDVLADIYLAIYHGETKTWPKPLRLAMATAWREARRWEADLKSEWDAAVVPMKTPEFRAAWRKREGAKA